MGEWKKILLREFERLYRLNLYRTLTPWELHAPGMLKSIPDGKHFIDLITNDYLGLGARKFMRSSKTCWGARASRLLAGTLPEHEKAEHQIARWKKCESALLLPAGYMANLALIQALARLPIAFLYDERVHASVRDGLQMVHVPAFSFRHEDPEDARQQVKRIPRKVRVVALLIEGVYSMDGDVAQLPEWIRLCEEKEFLLILDDAHGTGVLGKEGTGTWSYWFGEQSVPEYVLQVVTFSKALGIQGGAIVGARLWREWIINRGRACIFTTGISPLLAYGIQKAIQIVRKMDGERRILREQTHRFRNALREAGIPVLGTREIPVVPIPFNSIEDTTRAWRVLQGYGILTGRIRPPAIPGKGGRIRVALKYPVVCWDSSKWLQPFLSEEFRRWVRAV